MDLSVVLLALVGVAVVFVLAPVAGAVYTYYRGPKVVRCPETCRAALIRVNAVRASLDAVTGNPGAIVTSCSLWPRRRQCAQGCVAGVLRPFGVVRV